MCGIYYNASGQPAEGDDWTTCDSCVSKHTYLLSTQQEHFPPKWGHVRPGDLPLDLRPLVVT